MQHFVRIVAKRAAIPLSTGVSAQARADDEWVLPSVNGNRVLFRPYTRVEIDESAEEILALFGQRPGPSATICELSPDGSNASPGVPANPIVAAAGASRPLASARQNAQLVNCVTLAGTLARRPAIQSQIVATITDDPDFSNLLRTMAGDVDEYVAAAGAGVGSRQLMPSGGATSPPASPTARDAPESSSLEGSEFMTAVISAVSSLLLQTGGALAYLGHWLLENFAFLAPSNLPGDAPEYGQKTSTNAVMRPVMALVVIIVCLRLGRHPGNLRLL